MSEPSREERTLRDLEWTRVTEEVARHAASPLGQRLCREMDLALDPAEIRERLDQTSQARSVLAAGAAVPMGGLRDVTEVLGRLRKGASLDAGELLAMGEVLQTSRRVKNALRAQRERAPLLFEMAQSLISWREIEKRIEACFEPGGEVSDRASPELGQLRRRERGLHQAVIEQIQRTITRQGFAEFLQEELYTLRHGRYVVPVKIEHKGRVEGIVHDLSGSGQSIYIEPREVTELNNQLRTAELEIEHEIRRIFAELAAELASRVDEIELTLSVLARLDLIFARARYADLLGAAEPRVNREGRIHLRRLRHPLLVHQGIPVVPNDVRLGDPARTLVITGPNMGGKTVTLKAVGLAALMVRAGLHLPAAQDSEMAVFDRVFCDIGDQQSIERSLSTFSARILNLKEILEGAGEGSLVLLDEVGEGTDPEQGQALAQALLEALHRRGAVTIATTHFGALTALAYSGEGFANASMEFDPQRLEPTYRLLAGIPGRSNAIQIARRLGMEDAVVRRAEALLSAETSGLEQVLARLDEERRRYARDTERLAELRAEAEASRAEAERILAQLRRRRERMEEEADQGLRREVARARARIREAVARARDTAHAPSPRAIAEAGAELRAIEREVQDRALERATRETLALLPIEDWSRVREGDEVFVAPIRAAGRIVKTPDAAGRVVGQVRGSRLTLAKEKVMRRPAGKAAAPSAEGFAFVPAEDAPPMPALPRTLDLRGRMREEALAEVDAYLDAAVRARMPSVLIVHGHGTGVLKEAVREYLKTSIYVRSFRPGEQGEGGDGATYVEVAG